MIKDFLKRIEEELNEEREQLKASIKEAATGRTRSAGEVFAELGIEEEETSEQEKEILAELQNVKRSRICLLHSNRSLCG